MLREHLEAVLKSSLREYAIRCITRTGLIGVDEDLREYLVIPWVKTERSKPPKLRLRLEEDILFGKALVHVIMRYTRKALFKKNSEGKWTQVKKFYRGNSPDENSFIGKIQDLVLYSPDLNAVFLYEIRKNRASEVDAVITVLKEFQDKGQKPAFVQFEIYPRWIKEARFEYLIPAFRHIGYQEIPPDVMGDIELFKQHILYKVGKFNQSPLYPVALTEEEASDEDVSELDF